MQEEGLGQEHLQWEAEVVEKYEGRGLCKMRQSEPKFGLAKQEPMSSKSSQIKELCTPEKQNE